MPAEATRMLVASNADPLFFCGGLWWSVEAIVVAILNAILLEHHLEILSFENMWLYEWRLQSRRIAKSVRRFSTVLYTKLLPIFQLLGNSTI
jgi:hypothetical protein